MLNINLEIDEYIIDEITDVVWVTNEEQYIDNFVLSDKYLYLSYDKSNGFFSKSTTEIIKLPISEIKIMNNQLLVKQIQNDDYGLCLQIQFLRKREVFHFEESNKDTITRLINQLKQIFEYKESNTEAPNKPNQTEKTTGDVQNTFTPEQKNADKLVEAAKNGNVNNSVPPKVFSETKKCSSCGEQLREDAKFCNKCGNSLNTEKPQTKRTTIYDGEIHKCPNCGEVLEAFKTVCSSCGFEFRGASASNAIKEFTNRLNNINDQNGKVNLIRNFPVPNTKEDIFEFIILASTNLNECQNIKLFDAWNSKMEQCYQKAKLSFNNDIDFNKIQSIYEKTYENAKKTKRKKHFKKHLPILIWVSVMILCFASLGIMALFFNTKTIEIQNFSFDLPEYWDEDGSKKNYKQFYAETGDSVAMLSIGYPKETDDDYDVTYDGLVSDNDNMIESIEASFDDCDVSEYKEFESDDGIKGMLYKFTYTQSMGWLNDDIDGNGLYFCFPSENDRRWFYVILTTTSNVEKQDYKDDFMKMLSSIKMIEE